MAKRIQNSMELDSVVIDLLLQVVADLDRPDIGMVVRPASGDGAVLAVHLEGVDAAFAALQREACRHRVRERSTAEYIHRAQIELGQRSVDVSAGRVAGALCAGADALGPVVA